MSLIGALNIGKSAISAHQAAIQVTSNNVANAGNPDYTRQVAHLSPNADQMLRPGIFIGTGVNIDSVQRQIDEALEARLRSSISDAESAHVKQQMAAQLESIFNALNEGGISTKLTEFFNSWSNLANNPQDLGFRQVVVQSGDSLSLALRDARRQLRSTDADVSGQIGSLVKEADSLAGRIAQLNGQISQTEGGSGGQANNLRDQRDGLLKQLAGLIDIRTQDVGGGIVNVTVGSQPIILGAASRGLDVKLNPSGGKAGVKVIVSDDGGTLSISGGKIGGLLSLGDQVDTVVEELDSLAANLAFELNKIHSSGQGVEGFSELTSANSVNDAEAALNSASAGLANRPVNGSFVLHVKDKSTGRLSSTLVQVDLDGIGGETSLNSLKDTLDAIDGISAGVVNNKLVISADDENHEFSFSQDSSGALAALGINTFFTGKDAGDIALNSVIRNRPQVLAAAKNGQPADNTTARAIAALDATALKGLNGLSANDKYQAIVGNLANASGAANTSAEAADAVRDLLSSQREALSGVSLDEEAINLIKEQRAFQGAARIIAAVDEMMRMLMQIV